MTNNLKGWARQRNKARAWLLDMPWVGWRANKRRNRKGVKRLSPSRWQIGDAVLDVDAAVEALTREIL